MKLLCTQDFVHPNTGDRVSYKAGEVYEVEDALALRLLAEGQQHPNTAALRCFEVAPPKAKAVEPEPVLDDEEDN